MIINHLRGSKNRFDLEQDIMDCWSVVDDVKMLYEYLGSDEFFESMHSEHKRKLLRLLLGLSELYQIRFEKCFKTYEACINDTPEDRLSSEGAELLTAILTNPDMAASLHDRLTVLPRPESTVIMDRVLERARREQEWGTPAILDACIAVAKADPSLGTRVAGFLSERPSGQIKPSIVPKIGDQPWASQVFARWKNADVSEPVKKAIEATETSEHSRKSRQRLG